MQAFQLKARFIFLNIFLITVFVMLGCGQQENTKKAETTVGPADQEVKPPAVAADSQAVIPVNPATDIPEVKPDLKKDITPVDKMKIPEPVKPQQPVVVDKKTVPVVTPPANKPAVPTQTTPEIKVTEPVKPAPTPEPQPKPVEVTKPVPVVTTPPQPGDWIVPAKYKSMTSPFPANSESIDLGKSIYGTHCKSCHGGKGDGKGPKAATLDTEMRSFLSAQFQAQKPGEVYYKTIFGRKDMPKFDKKIPDEEDRWAVVNYIMSLK